MLHRLALLLVLIMALYELVNGTFVPYIQNSTVAEDVIICINDPPPVPPYLCLAVVDLIAYLIPCLTRTTYPAFRASLFALNVALFANVAFDIYLNPSYGISWLFIGSVGALGIAFYMMAKSWALFITLLAALAMSYWNAQDFSQEFFNKLFGTDLSLQTVNFLLFLCMVVTTAVFLLAMNIREFEWFVDSAVFSTLAVFAIQFLYFLQADYSHRAWRGEGGWIPDPYQLCCDDVHVTCPIWFTGYSVFMLSVLIFVRMAAMVIYEDAVEEEERLKKKKDHAAVPLLSKTTK